MLNVAFMLNLGNDDNLIGAQIRIEETESDSPPIVNARMRAHNFFNVLRVEILTSHNDEIGFSANHIKFFVQTEAQISRPIPTLFFCLCREIGAVVVPFKKRITLNRHFAYMTLRQLDTFRGHNAGTVARNATAGRYKTYAFIAARLNGLGNVCVRQASCAHPYASWQSRGIQPRLRHSKYVFRQCIAALQHFDASAIRCKRSEELFNALLAHRLGTIDEHPYGREIEIRPLFDGDSSGEELQREIRNPAQSAPVLGD